MILLFDLNGTLTSHTSQRNSTGINKPRPGVEHLVKLKREAGEEVILGIYSSASVRTVHSAIKMLEKAAGVGPGELFDRRVVLTRSFTAPAKQEHVEATGREFKAWDTVKPLKKYFPNLHRVLLFDDDQHKSLDAERDNLVLVPCWEDGNAGDNAIEIMVAALFKYLKEKTDDVRKISGRITKEIFERFAPKIIGLEAGVEEKTTAIIVDKEGAAPLVFPEYARGM